MPLTHRSTIAAALCLGAALVLAGCSSDTKTGSADAAAPGHETSTTPVNGYSSKEFVVPLTVNVDPALTSRPTDSRNLLTWNAAGLKGGNAIRFFVPVEVYPPDSSTPEPPPEDYLAYLLAQTAYGASISAIADIAVDDRSAKLMTLTIEDDRPENDLHGSLGCPIRGADRGDGCFGIQPDLMLRLAAIDMGDTTLLAWARLTKDEPDASFLEMFEHMLTTVRFR